MIITLGREVGSGGFEIGKRVAERLGLKFYDKELLAEAARESGICSDCFKDIDERVKTVYGGVGVFGMRFPFLSDPNGLQQSALSSENLFLAMSDTISRIAADGNALFVGRCADYILRERTDVLSVFVSANTADRVACIMKRAGVSAEEALSVIKRIDKQRAEYYDYYANRTWGAASSYNLSVNSSFFGIDGATDVIVDCARYAGADSGL